ncbi:unnamed protein product [Clonostachys rhizophaga]|uniref:CHAT domain-containing protein n=1 Tax=Clonostachys rhizophaga TaxID=160324 RepID=A0A9N9YM92_9HYPO|nr:unnamed protein product [Clonostachys rhizophaga]
MPKHHIARAHSLIRLGSAYDARYLYKGDEADDSRAEQAFKEALHHSSSPIVDRLRACKQLFFSSVERERWQSAYEVASTGVSLLGQLAPRSLVTSDKQRLMIEFYGLACDAAAVALMIGKQPYEAIRLLEIGRGVITGSLNEIHTDVSELIQQHPEIAKEYVRLRDQMSLSATESGRLELLTATASRASQRYDAGQKLERIIQTIRGLPNFDRFLMAPSEDELKDAAGAGPIVILNDGDRRCDALIITKTELKSIPLPQLKGRDMATFANSLGKPQSMNTRLLEWLWDTVAEPVLDSLGLSQTEAGSLPRVWWIPTGRLTRFPIHAAGYHLSGTQAVLDRVISSYAFSVRVLLQSRRVPSSEPPGAGSGKAVLVGMRETPRLSNLPFVPLEIDHLERICGSMQLKAFKPRPYRDDVLAALVDCDVFHFAGHGDTDRESPSQSSLVLLDGPLTVEELFNTSLHDRRPFLAYLSACGTGQVKNYRLLDEALHLIAAYQVSGFRHVIGTLWEVNDKSCVDAASMTYKWIQDQKMTNESVSEGLHRASVELRGSWIEETVARTGHPVAIAKDDNCSRDVPLEHSSPDIKVGLRDMDLMEDLPLYWVPYVHFGI